MINTARALYDFLSGFGLPAMTEGTVPDEMELPYITYTLIETEPLENTAFYVSLWFRSMSNAAMLAKVDEIKAAIGTGVVLPCDGGFVVLRPSNPFVQLMTDEDPEIRYAYFIMQINCYHE